MPGSSCKAFRFAGYRAVVSVERHDPPKLVGGEGRQATVTLGSPTARPCPLTATPAAAPPATPAAPPPRPPRAAAARASFLGGELFDWGVDAPHVRCGYSYPAVGQGARATRALARPCWAGALQFAGEATATRTSMTVHAALDTGVRAAARVAVRLGAARDLAHAAELQAAADARVAAAVRGIPPYVLTAPELLARWRSKL